MKIIYTANILKASFRESDIIARIGIAHFDPRRASTIETILTEADKSMYENKKNKVGINYRSIVQG